MRALFNLVLVFIAFCFSSCFEVIEEIDLKNNGTGNATLTLNFSSSKSKVASIMLLDSIHGYKIPSKQKVKTELDEVVAYLEKMEGISQVRKTTDFENYIATISFSFSDISNINKVNQNILKKLRVRVTNGSSYSYNKTKSIFSRNYQYTAEAALQYKKLRGEVKNVFKEAKYTSIYRFDRQVKSFDNKVAILSKSQKAIMFKAPILDLINGKINISNNILLSK